MASLVVASDEVTVTAVGEGGHGFGTLFRSIGAACAERATGRRI